MSGLGLIVNARSLEHRRDPSLFEQMKRQVGDYGLAFCTRNSADIEHAVAQCRRANIEVLALSGGDGTVGTVLSVVAPYWEDQPLPVVALVRGGTMNTIANAIGVRRERSQRLLSRLIGELHAERPLTTLRRPALDIEGRLGFLFGGGVLYGFLSEYYARGAGNANALTAVHVLARAFAAAPFNLGPAQRVLHRFEGSVSVDGHDWGDRSWFSVAMGTVDQVGLGFRPFHSVYSDPERFEVLAIDMPPLRFGRYMLPMRFGRPLPPDEAMSSLCSSVVMTGRDGRVRTMIDGDLCVFEGPVRVGLGPTLRLWTHTLSLP